MPGPFKAPAATASELNSPVVSQASFSTNRTPARTIVAARYPATTVISRVLSADRLSQSRSNNETPPTRNKHFGISSVSGCKAPLPLVAANTIALRRGDTAKKRSSALCNSASPCKRKTSRNGATSSSTPLIVLSRRICFAHRCIAVSEARIK